MSVGVDHGYRYLAEFKRYQINYVFIPSKTNVLCLCELEMDLVAR